MTNNNKPNRRAQGAEYERIAFEYLLKQGYRPVKRNFQFGRAGEIDLILRDGDTYVFVEVKARRNRAFGPPEEAVTPAKRRQIRRVAEGFIHVNELREYEARFDVVAIDFATGQGDEPEIRHYRNAF